MGILLFLLQWASLSRIDDSVSSYGLNDDLVGVLLREFNAFSESDLEEFIPQLTHILTERFGGLNLKAMRRLEDQFVKRCEVCMPFGLKSSGYLKVLILITLCICSPHILQLCRLRPCRSVEYSLK
jgi:hypothetical protein